MDQYINRPKTKRGVATMERIISAASEIFYEKGFYGGSITDITQRAGVGAGTFYIYFDSKLSLYRHLLIQYGKRIRSLSSQAVAGCTTRREAEREGIRSFFAYVLKDQSIFNIIWESLYIDKALFDDFYSTFSKSYAAALERAQIKGEVRDIDPQILSYVLMGIVNFVALDRLVLKQENDIDRMVDEVMKVLDGGMFK